jgi:heat shock protein HslJ
MEDYEMTIRFTTVSLAASMIALTAACAVSPAGPAPQDPAPIDLGSIANREWVLESFTLNGQPVTLLPSKPQTLEFDPVGKAGGSGGCNSYFTDYVLNGPNGISFGPVGATKMACEEGMIEETQFFEALTSTGQVLMPSATRLELKSADGQTVLKFVNRTLESSPEGLVGTAWVLTRLEAGQTPAEPKGENAPTLEFLEDGKLGGSGGCNHMFGTYEVGERNTIEVKDLGATLMACEDTGVMTLESDYFEALGKAGAYTLAGGELRLSSDDGSVVLTFAPQTR